MLISVPVSIEIASRFEACFGWFQVLWFNLLEGVVVQKCCYCLHFVDSSGSFPRWESAARRRSLRPGCGCCSPETRDRAPELEHPPPETELWGAMATWHLLWYSVAGFVACMEHRWWRIRTSRIPGFWTEPEKEDPTRDLAVALARWVPKLGDPGGPGKMPISWASGVPLISLKKKPVREIDVLLMLSWVPCLGSVWEDMGKSWTVVMDSLQELTKSGWPTTL